jgi:predicted RNase H-like HicB family nuclease
MKKYSFAVLVERDEDGVFVATVPSLRGCHTQAKSLKELEERIREAILLCLDEEKEVPRHTFAGAYQVEVTR